MNLNINGLELQNKEMRDLKSIQICIETKQRLEYFYMNQNLNEDGRIL